MSEISSIELQPDLSEKNIEPEQILEGVKNELGEISEGDKGVEKILSSKGYMLNIERDWKKELDEVSTDQRRKKEEELKKGFIDMIKDISQDNRNLRLRELVKATIFDMYSSEVESGNEEKIEEINEAFETGFIQRLITARMSEFKSLRGGNEEGFVKEFVNSIKGAMDTELRRLRSKKKINRKDRKELSDTEKERLEIYKKILEKVQMKLRFPFSNAKDLEIRRGKFADEYIKRNFPLTIQEKLRFVNYWEYRSGADFLEEGHKKEADINEIVEEVVNEHKQKMLYEAGEFETYGKNDNEK